MTMIVHELKIEKKIFNINFDPNFLFTTFVP